MIKDSWTALHWSSGDTASDPLQKQSQYRMSGERARFPIAGVWAYSRPKIFVCMSKIEFADITEVKLSTTSLRYSDNIRPLTSKLSTIFHFQQA